MAGEPNDEGRAGAGAEATPPGTGDGDWWLDRPGSVRLLIVLLALAGAASVAADLFYHKHGDYGFQEWIGFDAAFGFLAYVGLVTTAKGVRRLLMRSEDYYD